MKHDVCRPRSSMEDRDLAWRSDGDGHELDMALDTANGHRVDAVMQEGTPDVE